MQALLLFSASLFIVCDGQFETFLSRPDITGAVSVQITRSNLSSASPASGFTFLAPYLSDFATESYGPQIVDRNGELVWYGNETIHKRAMDLHVCDYKTPNIGDHLCLHDATPIQQGGHSSGLIRFFDNTYTEIDSYNGSGNLIAPDIHDLNTPIGQGGSSFIQDVYQTVSANLSIFSGPEYGYAISGCFQEIRFLDRAVVFQWCSLDYVPLDDTYLYIPQTADKAHNLITGDGSSGAPWDYFHINAIGKNAEGDYLVSSRHTDTIFKVAGLTSTTGHIPGAIIWRLGGKHNDFTMLDGLNFSRQHTVRFHGTTSTETQLTIFDNASDGEYRSAQASSGMWITLNNVSMTASLTHQYLSPGNNMSVSSQGQVQKLHNGNIFIGWGALPYYSEYTLDGDLLFHAHFGAAGADYMQSYRAWKYDWVGYPTEPPTLFLYAQYCNTTQVSAYVSWNGATDVSLWRFYTSAYVAGPFRTLAGGDVTRKGFETSAILSETQPTSFAYVEGLDSTGNVLGTSRTMESFVPASNLTANCTETRCGTGFQYVPGNGQRCG
jgi:hypothetical protein